MRRTLLRIVLRKEVLTTARLTAVFFIFLLFLSEFGFQASAGSAHLLEGLGFTLVCFSAIVTGAGLLRTVLVHDRIRRAEAIWLAGALVLIVLGPTGLHPWAPEANWPYLSFLMAFALIELSRLELGRNTRLFNPALLFAAGFVFMIALGTAFLMLPNAATRPLRFVDALFTATSAVCVTGLSTIDVSAGLTRSGQWLLLLLFQFGGLGIMTFTSFFAFFFKGRGSLEEQLRIRDIAQTTLGSARSFVVKVIAFSLGIEALGTVFCYLQLPATAFVDNGERLFFALFHSVSAFMNAGFSTWPAGLYTDSLRFNYPFQWTLIVLIVAGGLGFGIIFNFTRYLRSWVVERVRYWLQGGACQRFPRVIKIGRAHV